MSSIPGTASSGNNEHRVCGGKAHGTGSRVTRAHVERVGQIVDRHFKHWYNKLPESQGLKDATTVAKNRARAEVDALVAALHR